MLKQVLFILIAATTALAYPSLSEAKAKAGKSKASRSPASLSGCQISRKGTKIRCPHGMFIRKDVAERKIANELSGKKKHKKTKKKSTSRK